MSLSDETAQRTPPRSVSQQSQLRHETNPSPALESTRRIAIEACLRAVPRRMMSVADGIERSEGAHFD
jgi:hypothetical protein